MTALTRSLSTMAVLGIGIGLGIGSMQLLYGEPAEANRPQNVDQFNPSVSLAPLVAALSPAVVNIDVAVDAPQMGYGFPFGWPEGGSIQSGQGSGFIISDDGYVLTNYHVVDSADTLIVKLANEESYSGTIVGYDDSIDVALLKIDSNKPLPYVELGQSNDVRVGDWAVAIGNPFGLSHTVTSGIISAKERVIGSGPYDNYLQTDASINPGNSGGPLFNLKGQVIGINTAINPRAQGIGFSLPIDKVTSILEDLKTNGRPSRGWLGVGLKRSAESDASGAVVGEIYPNTPAYKAGLQTGDVVISFDGQDIQNADEFIRMVGGYRSGDSASMVVLRNGKKRTLSVTLGVRPSEKDLAFGTFNQNTLSDNGILVADASGLNLAGQTEGVVVLQISSKNALTKALRVGDLVFKINDTLIRNAQSFYTATQEVSSIESVTLFRNGEVQTLKP